MKNMEKILKQLSILLMLVYLRLEAGHSELIVLPHNIEVLVNHSTYFNCSTSIRSELIHWYHYRVGENQTIYVYYKGQFNKDYVDRYSIAIDTGTGEYNLIIRSIQPGDAGRYECQDDGGHGKLSSAELIVLDSTPICRSSMKPEGLVGPNSCGLPIDELQLSCSVSYSGNIPPTLQWKMEGDNTPILKGIASDYSGKRMTMNLTMSSGVEMNRASFTCSTTRSHDKQYSCTTGPVKTNYAIDQPKILNTAKGETITCSANATVPCIYRWFYGNDTLCPASYNQHLTTTCLEAYSCEASCTINGFSCTFVAMRIFVFENEASINRTYVIIICVLVSLGVGIISAFAGFGVGRIQKDSRELQHNPLTRIEHEEIELIEPQNSRELHENFYGFPVADRETIEKLTTENKRLLEKVNELEQLMYSSDNKGNKTAANLVHTIATNATEGYRPTPITGMTILENNLFVVKKNCPVVEVYDSKTFVFERLIETLPFTTPMDIASSKEDKFLYVINRENSESESYILKFKINGEVIQIWPTENDVGRLSTYESNLIVCFCTKRIIVEYTPEGEAVNTVRLSPGSGFNNIWHAIKLTGTHFAVSHSKVGDGQRVCVVDINGIVLAVFEELPKVFNKAHLPLCLVGHRNESLLVADAKYKRVLRLSPKELEYEGVLLETDKDQTPVRLCLNETKDRVFVGVNCGAYSKSETWKGGRILIYNIRK